MWVDDGQSFRNRMREFTHNVVLFHIFIELNIGESCRHRDSCAGEMLTSAGAGANIRRQGVSAC
jgi:hypothetical protein